MNEIRIYVEHLFQGKVLSEDVIELKEEIYGNLVARYEDYVASGMAADEALAKTKESITSIDDVLNCDEAAHEGAADVFDEVAGASSSADADPAKAASEEPNAAVSGAVAAEEPGAIAGNAVSSDAPAGEAENAAADTEPLPQDVSAAPAAAAGQPGGPVPPIAAEPAAAEAPKESKAVDPRKKWFPYAILAAVVVCVIAIAVVVHSCIDEADDRDDAAQSNAVQTTAVENDSQASGDSGAAGAADNQAAGTAQRVEDAVTIDDDGTVRYDNEVADDLLKAVVNSDYATVAKITPLSLGSTSAVETALKALPMADWLTTFDATTNTATLSVSYEGVSDQYDGDSIDAALLYNAAALMCASSDIDTIEAYVNDAEDVRERDYGDTYVFTRQMMEQQFGTALTSDFVTEEGWTTLKESNLYTSNFIDNTIDLAERD